MSIILLYELRVTNGKITVLHNRTIHSTFETYIFTSIIMTLIKNILTWTLTQPNTKIEYFIAVIYCCKTAVYNLW